MGQFWPQGLPCLLVRPLTNLQFKEGLRIPYCVGFCNVDENVHKLIVNSSAGLFALSGNAHSFSGNFRVDKEPCITFGRYSLVFDTSHGVFLENCNRVSFCMVITLLINGIWRGSSNSGHRLLLYIFEFL